MTRPEWDLAMICDDAGLIPKSLKDLLWDLDGNQLREIHVFEPTVGKDRWFGILAAAEAVGAISEVDDPTTPPEKRKWQVHQDRLDMFLKDVELILDILPQARERFSSDREYRIAATIPETLHKLQEFFRAFENTALGLRRMISSATSNLTILVPFMDADGLSEILPSLERALQTGVEVSFLTRELGEGERNLGVLSGLVDVAMRNPGDLRLLEAVLSDDTPISHAKVFSKDDGDEIYVGSANLTSTSMERTIEIGVFLKGRETRPIDEFLSLVKSLSRQRWP